MKLYLIKTKLSFITLIVMLGLFSISGYALFTEKNILLADRKVKTQEVVETAYGILSRYHDLEMSGKLTREQAQSEAMNTIKVLRYGKGEYFWINDAQPKVLMHPIKPQLDNTDVSELKDPSGKKLFVEFAQVVKQEGAGFVSYLWSKPGFEEPVRKLSYVKGFEPWGWIIGSGIYIDDIDTIFWHSTKWVIGITSVLTLLIYVLLRFIIASITKPLSSIQNSIQQIQSTKDLSKRVEIFRQDEIGKIAEAFNGMVASFQGVIHQVIEGVHEVQRCSTHLSDVSGNVSTSSKNQSDEAASMAAATDQMLASIEQVAGNSKHTHNIALESRDLSGQGEKIVNEAALEMTKIADAVDRSSHSINQLGEESKVISEIVKTIKEIADQTNLLALNAAIEAARAGEQGRGFAVVADEVRKLAERTSKSTLEIASMIAKIQAETKDAVEGMQIGSERVIDGVEKARQAGQSMANIQVGAQQVLAAVDEISAALSEQSSAGAEVAKGVENIAQMANSNSYAVADIASTANQLAHLAKSLQVSVDQFKA